MKNSKLKQKTQGFVKIKTRFAGNRSKKKAAVSASNSFLSCVETSTPTDIDFFTSDTSPKFPDNVKYSRTYPQMFTDIRIFKCNNALNLATKPSISVPKRQNLVRLIFGKNELGAFLESLRHPLPTSCPTMAMANL